MTMQAAESLLNAMLDAAETHIGTAPILRGRSGAAPANIAAASSGTVAFEMTLPSNWLADASGASKVKAGTWEDPVADATVDLTDGHWEIVKSDGTTRMLQGTLTGTGGGGDLEIDDLTVTAGQVVTVTSFSLGLPGL